MCYSLELHCVPEVFIGFLCPLVDSSTSGGGAQLCSVRPRMVVYMSRHVKVHLVHHLFTEINVSEMRF